jgi:hypothetical protein
LPKSRTNDSIVGDIRAEAVFQEQMLLNSVDLYMQCRSIWFCIQWNGMMERATSSAAKIFDCAQRGACAPSDIVGTTLQAIKFLDNGERNHDVTLWEGMKTSRICDQNRGVENNAGARANGVHRGARHRANGRLDVGTDLLRNMIDVSFWHPELCEVVDAVVETFLKKTCTTLRRRHIFGQFSKLF